MSTVQYTHSIECVCFRDYLFSTNTGSRRPSILPVPDMFTSSTLNIASEQQDEGDESDDEMDDDVPWRSPSEKIAWVHWTSSVGCTLVWVAGNDLSMFRFCSLHFHRIMKNFVQESWRIRNKSIWKFVDVDHVMFCDWYVCVHVCTWVIFKYNIKEILKYSRKQETKPELQWSRIHGKNSKMHVHGL